MNGPPNELKLRSPDAAGASEDQLLHFGGFSVDASRHLLFEDDKPVRLGSRAMAILLALLERPGALVTKEELVRVAWPETFVEEVNLRVHLAAIRRALHDSSDRPVYIANVSGRGYRFIAPVGGRAPVARAADGPPATLPGSLVQLIGRDEALRAVADMVTARRLVSVVGPGGIGKSSLAAVAAQRLAGRFADGGAYVDLSTLTGGRRVEPELLRALAAGSGDRPADVHKLLLIDSCDALIEDAAVAIEAVLRLLPRLHVLATSSEPLRAAGEHVYRLAPLDLPERDDIGLDEAMTHAAVRMLIERIQAGNETLRGSDRDVRHLVAISRKLDGLPLAIDMAAARIQVFGLQEVRTQLERGIEFLSDGRRTVAPRHRSMRGLYELNHGALSGDERIVLRRLSIFAGAFDLADASAVTTDGDLDDRRVIAALGGLVAKSQVLTARGGHAVRYRLSRPLRAYAAERLAASEDLPRTARRHADLALSHVINALEAWQKLSRAEWLERHGDLVEEVREALDRCLSPHGDLDAGALLAAHASPLLLRGGHYDEMRSRAVTALRAGALLPAKLRFRLHLQLATLTEDRAGPLRIEGRHLLEAARLGRTVAAAWADAELLLVRSALALRTGHLQRAAGLSQAALANARAAGRRDLAQTADRLQAEALHYAGDHAASARLANAMIGGPDWQLPAPLAILTSPPRGALRVVEARRLWLLGKPDQSRHLLFEALNFAAEQGPWALCEAIGLGACPLLLWYGEDDRAVGYITQLERAAEHAGLPLWTSWADLYRKVMIHIAVREGRRSESAILLQPASFLQAETWVTLTGSLRGLKLSPERSSGWCRPEILRAFALARVAEGDIEAGTRLLQEAIDLARTQGALAWELRATMSLARLWSRDRRTAAYELLAGTHHAFTEGKATSDLLAATALLRRLANG